MMTEIDENLMPDGQEVETHPPSTSRMKAWVEIDFEDLDDANGGNITYKVVVQQPSRNGEISPTEVYGPFPFIDDAEMDDRLINITNQILWSFGEAKE